MKTVFSLRKASRNLGTKRTGSCTSQRFQTSSCSRPVCGSKGSSRLSGSPFFGEYAAAMASTLMTGEVVAAQLGLAARAG